jgi:hypothetical protein
MSTLLWVLFQLLLSASSALLAVLIWQRRFELQLAPERQALNATQTAVGVQREALEERNRLRTTAVWRESWFLARLRTEQHRFFRNHNTFLNNRKYLVLQERILFRNFPLCSWVEQEIPVEEGANIEELARTSSAFSSGLLRNPGEPSRPSFNELLPVLVGGELVEATTDQRFAASPVPRSPRTKGRAGPSQGVNKPLASGDLAVLLHSAAWQPVTTT